MGSENSQGMEGWIPPLLYFHCLKINSNKIWQCESMSRILSKTLIKLMTSSLVRCNYVIFCFGVKVQPFTDFSIFGEIKLKIGGRVNFETLIAYFMSILPYKVNLIKIKGFNAIFLLNLFDLSSIIVLPW